jgi:hypothetical protein
MTQQDNTTSAIDTSKIWLTCKFCNAWFSPESQKINLRGYCKPCCLDNHIVALRAQAAELEKYQKEIYGAQHEYYKNMGWI